MNKHLLLKALENYMNGLQKDLKDGVILVHDIKIHQTCDKESLGVTSKVLLEFTSNR